MSLVKVSLYYLSLRWGAAIVLFAILWLLSGSAHSQVLARKFDSGGHPKAKGLQVSVRYPDGWRTAEGERPNIVQKFNGIYGGVPALMMLQIRELQEDIGHECSSWTANDVYEIFQDEDSGIEVKAAKVIRHENLPAFLLEWHQSSQRAGLHLHSAYHTMGVCYKQFFIMSWCGVVSRQASGLAAQLNTLKPLCQQHFNSVVLLDLYR